MTDARVQKMLDRLKLQMEACELNPMVGNKKVLEDAHNMIYDLRNRLRHRKPYDWDREGGRQVTHITTSWIVYKPMAEQKSNLLNFTIELNRDGNIEFNLDCVSTIEMEHILRNLGDPVYPHKIGNIVRHYFRTLQDKIKEERT